MWFRRSRVRSPSLTLENRTSTLARLVRAVQKIRRRKRIDLKISTTRAKPLIPTRAKWLAPAVVLMLTIGAIAAVWLLVGRASSSSEAQLRVASMRLSVANLKSAPFSADPRAGSPAASKAAIAADRRSLARGLTARAQAGVPPRLLVEGRTGLRRIDPVVAAIVKTALEPGGLADAGVRVPRLQKLLIARAAALTGVLDQINRADATRADDARAQTKLGAAAAMLLLLIAFAYFYVRSAAAREAVERLAREKEALLGVSRDRGENRRADRARQPAGAGQRPGERDRSSRPARRSCCWRCSTSTASSSTTTPSATRPETRCCNAWAAVCAAATEHAGSAYRMGGDEFCVLAALQRRTRAERLLDDAVAALQDSGEGWHVGCSHGAVWIPSEAATESQALKLADERMYANKASRSSASRQVTDALLQVITEQNVVPRRARRARLGARGRASPKRSASPSTRCWRIRLAAQLHDIGKTAIPAAILDKPGPLDEREWEFMRRHPLIGERIVLAAPALAGTAPLIRSSHERIDGRGYPDGLAGRGDPARLAHHRRLRRLRRDDIRPSLPALDRHRRGARGARTSRRHPVRPGRRRGVPRRDRRAARGWKSSPSRCQRLAVSSSARIAAPGAWSGECRLLPESG